MGIQLLNNKFLTFLAEWLLLWTFPVSPQNIWWSLVDKITFLCFCEIVVNSKLFPSCSNLEAELSQSESVKTVFHKCIDNILNRSFNNNHTTTYRKVCFK